MTLCREARVFSIYVAFAVPSSLLGLAVVLAVIRANKDDLPAIVRALMRIGSRDDHPGVKLVARNVNSAEAVGLSAARPISQLEEHFAGLHPPIVLSVYRNRSSLRRTAARGVMSRPACGSACVALASRRDCDGYLSGRSHVASLCADAHND
jgi:hypothetical protein